jgi:kinesin family protein C2/C3
MSQISSVKITDSWLEHDTPNLALSGVHTHLVKVDAKSTVARIPQGLEGAAVATDVPAIEQQSTLPQLEELDEQNSRLAKKIERLRNERKAAIRELRESHLKEVSDMTHTIAGLRCQVTDPSTEVQTLKMQLQRQQTEIASLKSAEARSSSQLASARRRMAGAEQQREAARAEGVSASQERTAAQQETAQVRQQMHALTEQLTQFAREGVSHKAALAAAEGVASAAQEEASAFAEEAVERAAEAASAAAAVQAELQLREREIDSLRGRLSEAQAEARDASALANASARQAASSVSAAVQALQEMLQGLRGDLCAAQQAAEEARAAVFAEQTRTARAAADVSQWKDRTARAQAENRTLFNTILDLKGNIRVFARIRPMGATGHGNAAAPAALHAVGARSLVVQQSQPGAASTATTEKKFNFDHVFAPESSQEEVFAEVAPLVRSVLDGYNVCVFAYGQTGAGKTHTMQGSAAAPGVNVRALHDLFALASERHATAAVSIAVSMCEIYNEKVRDLLARGGLQGAQCDVSGRGGVIATDPPPATAASAPLAVERWMLRVWT